jgi:HPt (histidine-containing phosphotransfer) domain-containing protein
MRLNNKKKDLSDVLGDLKKDYLSNLPQKISLIKKLTQSEDWKELYTEYHKLKGTGKTYGFPEISTLCAKMESFAQNAETQNKSIFEKAVELLDEIRISYVEQKPLDLSQHAFGKTLLKSGRKK